MMRPIVWMFAMAMPLVSSAATAQSVAPAPLELEAKIPLGDVVGRLDHFAFDPKRRRLFLAELGNNSVGVIDLDTRKTIRTIAGLKEPQGVAYVAAADSLYVANAADGSVRVFAAEDFAPIAAIPLGSDADNIRVDADTGRVLVGYGAGALAVLDATSHRKTQEMPLNKHPEGFQISAATSRIFVNVPDGGGITVLGRDSGHVLAEWPLKLRGNFPMALDEGNRHVLVVSRNPPKLLVLGMLSGELIAERDTCGDSDDVFFDAKRKRAYVSCGAGMIDVFDAANGAYRRVARIPTVPGARTSFFIATLDRFVLGVRAAQREPAAVWVYRPVD